MTTSLSPAFDLSTAFIDLVIRPSSVIALSCKGQREPAGRPKPLSDPTRSYAASRIDVSWWRLHRATSNSFYFGATTLVSVGPLDDAAGKLQHECMVLDRLFDDE